MPIGTPLRRAVAVVVALLLSGCSELPEPESQAAKLYVARCATCHRAYQPGLMTFEMWKLAVGRMQGVIARNGLRPLDDEEMAVLLDYLKRNSS